MTKIDIHEAITARMIAALERGTVPWHKPWSATRGRPRSMSTGRPYSGVNTFLLGLTAMEQGYASPWWGTYRQIKDLGGQVRKDEESTLVVFYKTAQVRSRDADAGDEMKSIPVLRYFRVFNASQADGLPARFFPEPGEGDQEITSSQAVLGGYIATGPQLQHSASSRACYNPAADVIALPLRSQFKTPEGYYSTAFHECGHSTGHPARLNRPGIAEFDEFGSTKYAKEELTAEMTAAILCAGTGIEGQFEQSAAYVADWLGALKNDHKLVVLAAAAAQKAADLITGHSAADARELVAA